MRRDAICWHCNSITQCTSERVVTSCIRELHLATTAPAPARLMFTVKQPISGQLDREHRKCNEQNLKFLNQSHANGDGATGESDTRLGCPC
jgi:hypothetical protein